MKIDNFVIGKGNTFIIAELSANHGHDQNNILNIANG